ncbi:hypothetical protein SAMN06275492_10863 [Dethiosulfovibrio salsuginis]|uniref:Ammonia monooxygenase n=2 Tax=Dethiosulfovibrio salsuginis TaxID=561720 RepID=A0A1X7J5Y8_9BACT|nr:hypothetical protein SAMN06275492_10863 [Dethiosulfovibrio salsuginis]
MSHMTIIWMAVGLGGFLGHAMRIPSGIMVGGMIAGLAVKIAFLPGMEGSRWLSVVSQLLVAGAIVFNSDVSSVKALPSMIPVALGYSVVMLGLGVTVALILSRFFGMDILTSLFAASPGGLSGLGLAATESEANAPLALMFHVSRITLVLITVPAIAKYLSR